MSATTFLLILAGVVVVFVGFLIKSWFELSKVTRKKHQDKGEERDKNSDA